MASDIVGFGKDKRKKRKRKRKDNEKKKLSNLVFLKALSWKFISNLVKRRIFSIYLNFGNLLNKN